MRRIGSAVNLIPAHLSNHGGTILAIRGVRIVEAKNLYFGSVVSSVPECVFNVLFVHGEPIGRYLNVRLDPVRQIRHKAAGKNPSAFSQDEGNEELGIGVDPDPGPEIAIAIEATVLRFQV